MHRKAKKLMSINDMRDYQPSDKMADLISSNYSLLQVMSRFGLSLGFGDKTVKEVCEQNGVHCDTFLAVVNFISEGYSRIEGLGNQISLTALVNYLRQSHRYFLDFRLPSVRKKLIEAIDCSQQEDVVFIIMRFYDEYMAEVRKHMGYEDKTVFTYVEALEKGSRDRNYKISTYSKHHDQVAEKLIELKNILIKYCPEGVNETLINEVLFDLYDCTDALYSHCMVEDFIFVPAVLKLENKLFGE